MNSLFWNYRGAGKRGRAICFSDIIRDHSLDFIGILETKKEKFTPKYLRKIDPFERFNWNWVPSVGKSGGILCGIKKETLDIVSWTIGKYLIQANVFDVKNKCTWAIIVVYGAPRENNKEEFLEELRVVCSQVRLPYIVGVTSPFSERVAR